MTIIPERKKTMADLPTFARRIRALARRTEQNVDRLVIDAALVIDQTVVLATPVDTGRARANWRASLRAPITEATEEVDPNGGATIQRNENVIRSRQRGQDIYISNNVVYIRRLNEGHSAQAPAGFVESAINAGITFIRRTRVVR